MIICICVWRYLFVTCVSPHLKLSLRKNDGSTLPIIEFIYCRFDTSSVKLMMFAQSWIIEISFSIIVLKLSSFSMSKFLVVQSWLHNLCWYGCCLNKQLPETLCGASKSKGASWWNCDYVLCCYTLDLIHAWALAIMCFSSIVSISSNFVFLLFLRWNFSTEKIPSKTWHSS